MDVIGGYWCLNSVGVERDACWCLVGGLGVSMCIRSMHDIVYYCSNVCRANSRNSKLYGGVSGGGVGSIPGAVVVHMLYGW